MTEEVEWFCGASCLAARQLLKLSREQFAANAGVSVSTLRWFEAGDTNTSAWAVRQIYDALNREGIIFVGSDRTATLK